MKTAFFRGGQECTPETIDRVVHEDEVEVIREHVGRVLPDLPTLFLDAATCMYSNTPDQHFVVAQHPAHEQRHRRLRLLGPRLQVRARRR